MAAALLQVAPAFCQENEIRYVQPVTVPLRAEPRIPAGETSRLARGEPVEIVERQGSWAKVRARGSTGWVPSMFLSLYPPVGAATLLKTIAPSEAKASRQRSSNFSVSAATRGFNPEYRVRTGREENKIDFEALDRMERFELEPGELDKFKSRR